MARYEVLNFRKLQARDAMLVFSSERKMTIAAELAESRDQIQERAVALRLCLGQWKSADRE